MINAFNLGLEKLEREKDRKGKREVEGEGERERVCEGGRTTDICRIKIS